MKIGIAHLAFRNFIVGFADSIERLDDVDTTIDQILSKLTGLMDANFRYGNVLRLVTNFDKMEADDCLRYALTAQMLAIYLDECTDFFTHLPEKCRQIMSDKNAWKNYTATVLMRHMGQLVCHYLDYTFSIQINGFFDFGCFSLGFKWTCNFWSRIDAANTVRLQLSLF